MPHLSFQYSAGLEARADPGALAATLRDAMLATGLFPLGGIRVRGFRADVAVIADGGAHDFVDMELRIGAGRDEAAKAAAAETIYAAAENWLRPRIGDGGFALSLELREIDAALSIKRFNTIRDYLEKAGTS
ncbi:5-carboxymethyl-2-hydroxymuconate Delta-isomerase [Pikeienuella piscinae]|uniref:5-carboxymethyl-2-hydroxymuconate Delta-isomerase n=1 Tax=Pikeienuella piscinae TaxID=2748098 RepID=A0A7L5BZ09_9RHOB|nr:5-carboxymethyl-2-hydroxymuconate Delta-isomerase [Pikeienuella piscinae]QIE54839.1 5-carboxymethyl-2-hydroxymuconate Delta-isomerase [Pikeienuella piscinae]